MCGINGFTSKNEEAIRQMNNLLYHRGPDGNGIYSDENITLGHTRLKIIDLSERAAQPMSDSEGKILLIFNGEIYNFKELRKELEGFGYKFNSDSDSEVIIYSYKQWGYDCVNHFNGMWAFAIYDKNNHKIFLSRDRFGKKPLYYYNKDNKFIFSSEIKPLFVHEIEKKLNKKAVSSYLSYRYVLGEETMLKDVFKLLPAHNMVFDISKKQIEKIWEYWKINKKEIESPEEETVRQKDTSLKKSISFRKISDVPLGVILSGGLDSSLITAVLAKEEDKSINTFTVKFNDNGFDESVFAKIVAEQYNTNHNEVEINLSNFMEVMKEYTKFKSEPIGVPNEIALYLLSKKIKKNVTVVLSGEGADEVFEGYGRIFTSARDYEIMNKLKKTENGLEIFKNDFSQLHQKYKKLFSSELEHFLFMYNYWTDEEKDFILEPDAKSDFKDIFKKHFDSVENLDYQKKISYILLKLHLPGLLNRLDNPTMANSVEARAPFLDYELVEKGFNLPGKYKTRWTNLWTKENANKNCDELSEIENSNKYILKEVARKYLPPEIFDRKKQGFPLPLDNWFKGELENVAKELLLKEDSKIKEVINQKNLAEWMSNKDTRNLKKFGQKLWMLVSLELWLREWF